MEQNSVEITSQFNNNLITDINMTTMTLTLITLNIDIYAYMLGRGINYDVFLNNESFCKYYSQRSPSINPFDNLNIIRLNGRSLNANLKRN